MTSRGSQQTRSRSIRSKRWSFGLRCVLLIVAWQGPMPWCHCHGTLATLTDQSPQWLSEHLRSHHAALSPFSNAVLGWHVHFEYPSPSDEDSDQPVRPRQDRLLVTSLDSAAELMTRAATTPTLHPDSQVDVGHDRATLIDRAQSVATSHFYDGFAPSLSLPQRFCVSRC
jgi:hypothetical protein